MGDNTTTIEVLIGGVLFIEVFIAGILVAIYRTTKSIDDTVKGGTKPKVTDIKA